MHGTFISMPRPWTSEDDESLRALFVHAPWDTLSVSLPGRTKRAIWNRAHRLGLPRRRREDRPETRAQSSARAKTGEIRRGKFTRPVEVRGGVEGKVCAGPCGAFLPLERFAQHEDCAGGRRAVCTTCEGRVAYARNPKRIIRNVRAYQARNADTERLRKRASNRRRHGRMAEGPGLSVETVRALLAQPCAYCGAPATTLDHDVPVSRGGVHGPENVVPACASCNFKKHTKTGEEFRAARKEA